MARNGSPDDPNYSDSDPTQYANYGGSSGEAYSDYQQSGYGPPTGYASPPPEPTPWYRKPAGLVALGVLTAIVLAFLVYAVVKFTGGSGSSPASTTTTTPSASVATTTSAPGAPPPAGTTQTVTQSPSSTAEAPSTTTEAPVTTTTQAPSTSTSTSTAASTSVSTSVSTVTETVTTTQRVLPTLPTLFPRPGGGQ